MELVLKLYWGENARSRQESCREFRLKAGTLDRNGTPVLDMSPVHDEIPDEWSDGVFVEAELAGDDPGLKTSLKKRFQLALRGRADYTLRTDKDGAFEVEAGHEAVARVQLWRGAAGFCCLDLVWRTNLTSDYSLVPVATYRVRVKPERFKRESLKGMVNELIRFNVLLAFSCLDGLSNVRLEKYWRRQNLSSDVWEPGQQLEEMEALYSSLAPNLQRVAERPMRRIVASCRPVCVERLDRFPPKYTKGQEKRGGRPGRRKVLVQALQVSYDLPIHRAIKGFLLDVVVCLDEIDDRLAASIASNRYTVGSIPSHDGYSKKDIEAEIREKERLRKQVADLRSRFRQCLGRDFPWSDCPGLSAVTLKAADVPAAPAYRAAYVRMVEFLKKRNFSGALEGGCYLPEFSYRQDCDEEPSAWLKNYSYVYEAWFFKRLVQAFVAEGYAEVETNYRKLMIDRLKNIHLGPLLNDPIHACVSRDGLEVDIYYGLLGYRDGGRCMKDVGFSCRDCDQLTPDYAIVFTKKGKPGGGADTHHWIVLDAKSTQRLRRHDTAARDKYLQRFKYRNSFPNQVWLVYSGPDRVPSGWEFDGDDMPKVIKDVWDEELRQRNPRQDVLFFNQGLTLDAEKGICGDMTGQVAAHLRANVFNDPEEVGGMVQRFVHMQIATARAQLGFDSEEDML